MTTLTIEVPDAALAESLRRELLAYGAGVVQVDGRYDVAVDVVELNPERRVVNVLNVLDAWLVKAGVGSVRVRLDGNSYTLHAPPSSS